MHFLILEMKRNPIRSFGTDIEKVRAHDAVCYCTNVFFTDDCFTTFSSPTSSITGSKIPFQSYNLRSKGSCCLPNSCANLHI